MRQFLATLFGMAFGCSPASPSASGSRPEARAARAEATAAPPVTRAPTGDPAAGVAAPQSPAAAVTLPFVFTRVEATAVSSVAPGKPPKLAFLSAGEALVFDGTSFLRLPAPETRAPELSVEIFFGRDDEPRLMGYRRGSDASTDGTTPYYRRYKAGRFQAEPGELGPLAGPSGALYGVLGHADPEVVCRPRLFCLVKRTTGWGRAPAHAEPVRILLAGDTAWALHRDRIERLERDAWVPLAPQKAWDQPVALFVNAEGTPWVVEAKRDAVTHLVEGRWVSTPVPLHGPRAIAGTQASDVWLVGEGGAAHFDGLAWREVSGVSGPLALVLHSPPDLWLAGEAGVFRGTPTKRE